MSELRDTRNSPLTEQPNGPPGAGLPPTTVLGDGGQAPRTEQQLRDALLAYASAYECPGIEVEPGRTSGCNANFGDCPTCQVVQEAIKG